MSEFSDLLKQLMKEKGIIAPDMKEFCEVELLDLIEITLGRIVPESIEVVNKMSEFLCLTPIQEKELKEKYYIAKFGKQRYQEIQTVKEFCLNFYKIKLLRKEQVELLRQENTQSAFFYQNRVIEKQYLLNTVFRMVLEEEFSKKRSKVKIFCQTNNEFLNNLLYSYGNACEQVVMEQIICLNKEESFAGQRGKNLKILSNILPFYDGRCEYQCYYYKDDIKAHYNDFSIFPYFLLTKEKVVVFSTNYKQGMLFTEPEIVEYYKNIFEKAKEKSEMLNESYQKNMSDQQAELFGQYISVFSTAKMEHLQCWYEITKHPCILTFFSEDILKRCLNPALYANDQVKKILTEEMKRRTRHAVNGIYMQCYTKEGIEFFVQTGILATVPNGVTRPLESEDRAVILHALIMQVKEGKGKLEKLPLNIHIELKDESCIIIFQNRLKQEISLTVKDSNITNLFFEFCDVLELLGYAESMEETVTYLKSMEERCKMSVEK